VASFKAEGAGAPKRPAPALALLSRRNQGESLNLPDKIVNAPAGRRVEVARPEAAR